MAWSVLNFFSDFVTSKGSSPGKKTPAKPKPAAVVKPAPSKAEPGKENV